MKSVEIIVVGAGCVGANVAYRLAERGARVTVLEAGAPGHGTSGATFAWPTRSLPPGPLPVSPTLANAWLSRGADRPVPRARP